jgi:peroxiredoxin Q/BCP
MSATAQSTTIEPISIGDQAPDFTAPTDKSESLTLSSLQGKNIVLYFYPKDDTPGCTVEANDFTALKEDFAKTNTIILGVSKDSVAKHCKFVEKYSLGIELISDEDGAICELYGAWVEKSMYGKKYMGIDRRTFLIDAKSTIKEIWTKVKAKDHAAKVLEAAQAL